MHPGIEDYIFFGNLKWVDICSKCNLLENEDPVKTKPSAVVAPVTRTTSSKKIRLSTSQVNLAKKLGLTPEQYAKELIRLENRNG